MFIPFSAIRFGKKKIQDWGLNIVRRRQKSGQQLFWQPIDPGHIWAFLLIGLLGAVSQALLIRAFALAEASAIAPFGYTGLIWAGFWGWLVWGAIPDLWTVIGALIIVLAGIYVWMREARAMKRVA